MPVRKFFQSVKVNSESDLGKVEFYLDYYILEKEIQIDGFSINTYGIEVAKRDKINDASTCLEYRKIYDVFCTERETIEVLEKLIRNTVTPVSVLDVLQDLIGTGDFVNEELAVVAI